MLAAQPIQMTQKAVSKEAIRRLEAHKTRPPKPKRTASKAAQETMIASIPANTVALFLWGGAGKTAL
jgi:hypothetical protein